jgi:hypothetical protein
LSLLLLFAASTPTPTPTPTPAATSLPRSGMTIIRPKTIDDTALVSSNIIESAPAEWSILTTYASGDQVAVTAGTNVALYQSLAAANTGNDPATSLTWWESVGAIHTPYDSAAVYAAGDRVVDLAGHRIYESAFDANTGNVLTDVAWWIDAGATNRWAMFDTVNGTLTTHPEQIDVTVQPVGMVDALALLNLDAATVRVIVNGGVYDQTITLTSTSGIDNWYAYLFSEVVRRSDVTFYDLPPYASPSIEVIIDGGGGAAQCGTMVVGLSRNLGGTQYGATVGIDDFSRKETDDFGNYTVVPRAFRRRGDFKFMFDNTDLDEIVRLLSLYRATPIIYDATSGLYGSALVFGFYKSFDVEIAYPTKSLCTLSTEGLT